MTTTIEPPPPGTVFTRDPVQITTGIFTLLLGVTAVLTMTGVLEEVISGVITGVLTAAWAAVNQLLVRPATVPRQPLAELAYEMAQPASTVAPASTLVVEVESDQKKSPPKK